MNNINIDDFKNTNKLKQLELLKDGLEADGID